MGSKSERLVLPISDCLDNPKAVTPHTKLFSMSKKKNFVAGEKCIQTTTPTGSDIPENQIKQLHAENRQSTLKGLMNRSVNQLINDFIVEMDAKNKAYYFILENGHFDAFKIYCSTPKTDNT